MMEQIGDDIRKFSQETSRIIDWVIARKDNSQAHGSESDSPSESDSRVLKLKAFLYKMKADYTK